MSILLFSSESECCEKLVEELHDLLVVGDGIERFHTIEQMKRKLRQPCGKLKIAVLITGNQDELNKILSIRDLLSILPIILITPDNEKETINKGHKLYPRFLSSLDSDPKVVSNVVNKILENIYKIEIELYSDAPNDQQNYCEP